LKLVGIAAVLLGIVGAVSQPVSVGVARIDITPSYPVRLNGFGFRRAESEGVRQQIWAKSLAIGDDASDGGPLVLIAVDGLGIPDRLTRQLASQLAADHVRPERLAVVATHTHTAPMINHVSPTLFGAAIPPEHQAHIDRYSDELADKLLQVARQALRDRRPARLSWGVGRFGLAANRRTPGGPVDHELPLLAVYDTSDQLRALWVSYACHCVTLSDNLISGDWAGFAQSEIERLNPGCTALVSIGCGADANPNSGVTGNRGDVAQSQGAEMAAEVLRLLKTRLIPLAGPIVAQHRRITLPLAPLPTRQQWQELAAREGAVGFHAQTQLARLDRGESLLTEIDYPMQTWAFGDSLAMVFLPGEVVVDYSLRLKRELDGRRLWINAYANHCPGYVPSERILREGGYEGGGAMIYYDIPAPYAPGLEQQIVDQVRQQVGPAFSKPDQGLGTHGVQPRTAEESLALIQVRPELEVQLVAAEPLVTSPVAIAFGTGGELWVAEMFDYPNGIDGQFGAGGRVKLLHDHDGDGRYDAATVFLDSIPFPTGVTAWRDGVLVCAAPNILIARDTDGDGRADQVHELFSGFGTDNYQGRVNSLEYGLDGWLYGSCGLFGGNITTLYGQQLSLGDRDFRILPDQAVMEPATGRTQQGRVRDDWGAWFGCDNSTLLYHYPLADHYVRRNPHFSGASSAVYVLADADAGKVFPRSEPVLFELSGPPGRVTAGCGLGIYRDDYLGSEFQGNSFTCEPVNNLVTRRLLTKRGSSFEARRAGEEAAGEFLASSDPWFRPVQVRTGPDGALWVVDMYRYVIEHPRWIPAGSLAQLDVRAGASRGRIYRVVRRDLPPRVPVALRELSVAQCVAALDSPNGTQRDLASQQIMWMDDAEQATAVEPLVAMCTQTARPVARLHALILLDQLNALPQRKLTAALRDPDAGVRQHAVRIAERYCSAAPEVLDVVLGMDHDPDPHVRLQLACSLGAMRDPRAAAALAGLLRRAPDNTFVGAVVSSLTPDNITDVVRAALEVAPASNDSVGLSPEVLGAQAAALASPQAVQSVVEFVQRGLTAGECLSSLKWLEQLLIGLQASGDRRDGADVDDWLPTLAAQIERCRELAGDDAADVTTRTAAVHVLGCAPKQKQELREQNVSVLISLLSPQAPLPLQEACVAALEQIGGDDIADRLLQQRSQLTPALQSQIIDVLLRRGEWTDRLEQQLRTGGLRPTELSLAQQNQLLQLIRDETRERVAELLQIQASQDRQAVIALFAQAVAAPGDAPRGRQVFVEKCASCHRVSGLGRVVGPDISSYATKPADALLIAVLDPNQAIDPRYLQYVAETSDGRVLNGIITDETATGVVLTDAQGKATSLLRRELERLHSQGTSLMPEGMERELSPMAMADLVAFLKSIPQ
jgi:putative membrane-bound dehydrogenase-like protein